MLNNAKIVAFVATTDAAKSRAFYEGALGFAPMLEDEFAIVLEGVVELHTEVYGPLKLEVGESVYFDSSAGHAYLNAGPGTARIMTIACDSPSPQEAKQLPVAKASKRTTAARSKVVAGQARATRSARS